MRLPQPIINRAYDLHYMLVESYKMLNEHLLEPDLSDEKRIAYYMAYFSTCEEVGNRATEITNLLCELKTQSCFSFFRRTDEAVKHFLAITYDQKDFDLQEKIRQQRDSFIKSIPSPLFFRKNLIPSIHFYDNGFLVVNTQSKRFATLFQKSIEKTRDHFLENKMQIKIAAVNTTTLTEDEKTKAIAAIVSKTQFKHPFFLYKYQVNQPLSVVSALDGTSNCIVPRNK